MTVLERCLQRGFIELQLALGLVLRCVMRVWHCRVPESYGGALDRLEKKDEGAGANNAEHSTKLARQEISCEFGDNEDGSFDKLAA